MKLAIVGSGIAGNVLAYRLHAKHDITLYEAANHVGGHSHTHSVEQDGRHYEVDTGFIVFNDRTYPNFIALLRELGVSTQESSMSFSVKDEASGLEYNGTTLNTLFAQRRNLLRPSFLGMIRDIVRFNQEAVTFFATHEEELPLGDFLASGGYGRAFVENYIVPMGAAIWSTDPKSMLAFPARFFVRFLHHHGMLSINERPIWRTISGGSARYVEKLTHGFRDRILLNTPVEWIRRPGGRAIVKAQGHEPAHYDAVFLACHSDQAFALLSDPSKAEQEVLRAIPYQANEAVLHTDTRLLPRNRRAWAAWNYHRLVDKEQPVALTYNMNILQRLNSGRPFLVTLNRADAIDPSSVIKRITYHHPLFTSASVVAQARQRELNGVRATYFCGAWWRNGFHEDAMASALQALDHFEQDNAERTIYRTA